jgi:hypothetical protein
MEPEAKDPTVIQKYQLIASESSQPVSFANWTTHF